MEHVLCLSPLARPRFVDVFCGYDGDCLSFFVSRFVLFGSLRRCDGPAMDPSRSNSLGRSVLFARFTRSLILIMPQRDAESDACRNIPSYLVLVTMYDGWADWTAPRLCRRSSSYRVVAAKHKPCPLCVGIQSQFSFRVFGRVLYFCARL